MTENEDLSYLTNRQKAQIPKRKLHWCDSCDRALVGQFGKCSACGFVKYPRKIKVSV